MYVLFLWCFNDIKAWQMVTREKSSHQNPVYKWLLKITYLTLFTFIYLLIYLFLVYFAILIKL